MNFFALAENARKKTTFLLLLFILAVISICFLVNAIGYGCFFYFYITHYGRTLSPSIASYVNGSPSYFEWLTRPFSIYIFAITLFSIFIVSLYRFYQISSNIGTIAQWAGGREILSQYIEDAQEKKLVNVVEEMSIASGVPVPAIYILDEELTINAFVAGFNSTDTLLCITKGAVSQLSRDELQGVVGHEFSHILNGDMKTNMTLTATLAGIQSIYQVGHAILRINRHSKKTDVWLLLLGFSLSFVGFVGVFFGRLVRSAILREREFLADASSVQFTRNPEGIAGALYKISQNTENNLVSSHVEDLSHLCFSQAQSFRFERLFATHPDIDKRILAVCPGFSPQKIALAALNKKTKDQTTNACPIKNDLLSAFSASQATPKAIPEKTSARLLKQSVGQVTPQQMQYAEHFLNILPESFLDNCHTAVRGKSILYFLLSHEYKKDPKDISSWLLKHEGTELNDHFNKLSLDLKNYTGKYRVPLLQMALIPIKALSDTDRTQFLSNIEQFIALDGKISLFETLISLVVKKTLSTQKPLESIRHIKSFKPVLADIDYVLHLVLTVGGYKGEDLLKAKTTLLARCKGDYLCQTQIRLSSKVLYKAMMLLAHLNPLLKQTVVELLIDAVEHDQKITLNEADLIRIIGWLLECPIPPLSVTE